MINEQIEVSTRKLAHQLFDHLRESNRNIVFAESCTAGLVSAVMAGIPGVSAYLCGSAVTYHMETKQRWLQIESGQFQDQSAVSADITACMALAVLDKTPQADVSVAITGHLQNDATSAGSQAWVAAAIRNESDQRCSQPRCFTLEQTTRIDRQWEAARRALQIAVEEISQQPVPDVQN